ncbi:MAG: hypothetical protein AB8G15_07670 [Saprospiraceae bacterium]
MKNLIFLQKTILFSLVLLLAIACGKDDETITPVDNSPTIDLVDEATFISSDTDLEPGSAFQVKLSASQGTSPLNTLTIMEDNVKVALDRISINSSTGAANPALILGDDKTSLVWTVEIQGATTEGSYAYDFIVTDEDGLTGTAFLNINYVVQGTLTMVQTPGSGSSSVCTVPNTLFAVSADATRAGSPLNQLAIYEDGVLVTDLTRLRCDNVEFDANPVTLKTTDKEGFTDKEILIRTHEPATKVYTIEVIDEAGNSESFDITIQTGTEAGVINNAVLTNRTNAGLLTGGLDLSTGNPTGTTSAMGNNMADATIRDRGNDGSGEWYRSITSINGSEIKTPFSTIDFNALTKREEIVSQFNLGNAIATNSDPIEIGDIFLVKRLDNYFIIQAVEVNETPVGDEDDNIVFNIKQ